MLSIGPGSWKPFGAFSMSSTSSLFKILLLLLLIASMTRQELIEVRD